MGWEWEKINKTNGGGCSFFFLIRNDIRTNYLVSVQFIYNVKSHREHLFSNSVPKKIFLLENQLIRFECETQVLGFSTSQGY